jgi:hypothetical protein
MIDHNRLADIIIDAADAYLYQHGGSLADFLAAKEIIERRTRKAVAQYLGRSLAEWAVERLIRETEP